MTKSLRDAILQDQATFAKSVLENIILDSWKKKIWACWKILIGEAGILLVRLDPEDLNEKESK